MTIIPKFDGGGGFSLPFVDYMPYTGLQAESAGSSKSESSDEEKKEDVGAKEILSLVKDLEGLPVDIQATVQDLKMLYTRATMTPGKKLTTSAAVSIYLSALQKVKMAKFNKEAFNQIRDVVKAKDGLDEAAIDKYGRVYAQDSNNGQIQALSIQDYLQNQDQYDLLTNSNLLNYRANNPAFKFNNNILEVVENGIGQSEVTKIIHTALQDVQNTEINGYSTKATLDIQQGIALLDKAARQGVLNAEALYKLEYSDNSEQILAAMNYLWQVMPTNARAWLAIKSGNAKNPTKGARDLMLQLAFSKHKHSAEFAPAKNPTTAGGSDGSDDKDKTNFFMQMQKQQGGETRPITIVQAGGDTGLRVDGTWYSQIMAPGGKAIYEDMSVDRLLHEFHSANIFNLNGITIGDQRVDSDNLKDIMYNHSKGLTVATLPCYIDRDGNKVVNLNILEKYRELETTIREQTKGQSREVYEQALAKALQESGFEFLVKPNGKINYDNFGEFALIDVITTDKIPFDTNSRFLEKVTKPTKELEQRLINALSTPEERKKTKNQTLYEIDIKDKWSIFEWMYDDIYKATMFIPMNQNPNSAKIAWGTTITENESARNEQAYQDFLKYQRYNPVSLE